jgi:hypothetical protein
MDDVAVGNIIHGEKIKTRDVSSDKKAGHISHNLRRREFPGQLCLRQTALGSGPIKIPLALNL